METTTEIRDRYKVREKGDLGFALWRHHPRRDGATPRQIGIFETRERAEEVRSQLVREDQSHAEFLGLIHDAEQCTDPRLLKLARTVLKGANMTSRDVSDLLDAAIPYGPSLSEPEAETGRYRTVNHDFTPVPVEAVTAIDAHLLDGSVIVTDDEEAA